MKRIYLFIALLGFLNLIPRNTIGSPLFSDILVPAGESEFEISPTSFTVDGKGGTCYFDLTCERWIGRNSLSADPADVSTTNDLPPLEEMNVNGFEYIGFEDTGGQVDSVKCRYSSLSVKYNSIVFKPNRTDREISGTVTIRHYTLYTDKPKQERTLVVTYKQKRIGPTLPPENELIDGGRITSSINRNDVSLPVTIRSISLPAGVVGNITYRWEYKDGNSTQWSTLAGATDVELVVTSFPPLIRYYRRVATTPEGDQGYSNVCCSYNHSLSNHNYISKITPRRKTESMMDQYMEENTYYNGLGYPMQVVQAQAVSNGDLVTPIVYDRANRSDAKKYLPFAVKNNGGRLVSDPLTEQEDYYLSQFPEQQTYSSAPYAYIENEYENSPLNRIKSTRNAGAVFRTGNEPRIVIDYQTNAANEVLCLQVDSLGNARVASYYEPHMLFKNSVTNEDGTQTISFKDKRDSLVLQRTVNGVQHNDTYYVYDDFGRLSWVISPEGSASLTVGTTLNSYSLITLRYCYIYRYDGQGRLVSRKLPGRNEDYYVYDRGDNPVMSQDGMQRLANKWILNRYDRLSRLTRQAEIVDSRSRAQLQALFDNGEADTLYRSPDTELISFRYDSYPSIRKDMILKPPSEWEEVDTGGGIVTFPGESTGKPDEYEVIIGGKEYVNDPLYFFTPVEGIVTKDDVDTEVVSMKTVERLALLAADGTASSSVSRYYFYDYAGRVVQLYEEDSTEYSRYSYRYDFNGNVLAEHQKHGMKLSSSQSAKADSLIRNYSYDRYGRLTSETSVLNGGTPATVQYAYDDMGRLASKTLGNGTTETMAYNIQGWLSEIDSRHFDMKLDYYESDLVAATPYYSGNVSAWTWSLNGSYPKNYVFTYDRLGRLTDSHQYSGTSRLDNYVEHGISYDRNGNIRTLKRTWGVMPVDDLFYEYEGNQLSYLTERATASMATNDVYVPGPTARMGYSYDSNGNMTNDYRKGLKFQYNFVNLVRRVQDDGGSTLAEYTYSVDGRKRQAVGGDGKGFRYRGDLVYTVEGGSLSLESAAFGEGRIAKTSGSYSPLYFVTDHLGSVRVVEDQSGTVCESNDYYPSGSRWKDPTSKVSTNRYRFSGKEEQTLGDLGYLDFGARMYDPALGRWFTQDPLAEKYYSVSPYAYCNNNPIKLIDPDGRMIWIYGYDNSRYQYMPGMSYTGFDPFVANVIKLLNLVATNGGMKMLNTLAGSVHDYNIFNNYSYSTDVSKVQDRIQFEPYSQGGGEVNMALIMTGKFNDYQRIETIAHELYHGLQAEMGQGGASVFNEVTAYVYGLKVAENWANSSGNLLLNSTNMSGQSTKEGFVYMNSMWKLMNKYTTEDLVDAVNSFKSGSYSNSKGIYDGLMFIRKNQNESLIRSYYPSLPTHNEPIIK